MLGFRAIAELHDRAQRVAERNGFASRSAFLEAVVTAAIEADEALARAGAPPLPAFVTGRAPAELEISSAADDVEISSSAGDDDDVDAENEEEERRIAERDAAARARRPFSIPRMPARPGLIGPR